MTSITPQKHRDLVVLHLPRFRQDDGDIEKGLKVVEKHFLASLVSKFNGFEKKEFDFVVDRNYLPKRKTKGIEYPCAGRRVLFYYHYAIGRHHTFDPSTKIICTNTIDRTSLAPLMQKHRTSQHAALRAFMPSGLDFSKFDADAEQQLRDFIPKCAAVVAKPSWGRSGNGMLTSADPQVIVDHINSHKNTYPEWRIEQYIDNTMLVDGRKFHLGAFVLLVRHKDWPECKFHVFDDQLLVPAVGLYTKSDWSNPDIHDTHASRLDAPVDSARKGLFEKMDPSLRSVAQANIGALFAAFEKCIDKEAVRALPDLPAEVCCGLMRMDIMLEKDGSARFLEINTAPGTVYVADDFLVRLFDFVAEKVCGPGAANILSRSPVNSQNRSPPPLGSTDRTAKSPQDDDTADDGVDVTSGRSDACAADNSPEKRKKLENSNNKRDKNDGEQNHSLDLHTTPDNVPKDLTFSYYFPPDMQGRKIDALTLTLPQHAAALATIYYPKNLLNFSYGACPKMLGYNTTEDLVHNGYSEHVASIHKRHQPYDWHCHVKRPRVEMMEFVSRLLNRHSPTSGDDVFAQHHKKQIEDAETKFRQLAANQPDAIDAASKAPGATTAEAVADVKNIESGDAKNSMPRRITFADGSVAEFGGSLDESGLGLLSDIKEQWGERPMLSAKDQELITEAAERMREGNAVQIIKCMLARYHPVDLANWSGRKGYLQHYVVAVKSLDGISLLLRYPEFGINKQRAKDQGTIMHLINYMCRHIDKKPYGGGKPSVEERIRAHILRFQPDLKLQNKFGDSAEPRDGVYRVEIAADWRRSKRHAALTPYGKPSTFPAQSSRSVPNVMQSNYQDDQHGNSHYHQHHAQKRQKTLAHRSNGRHRRSRQSGSYDHSHRHYRR